MSDESKKTPDEPAAIQVTVGPYAGQRLTMSRADADAAIAEKWAVDPFAPPPTKEEEEKQAKEAKPMMTEEERAEITAKAEKAARKLRGEPEPEEPAKEAAKPEPSKEPHPSPPPVVTRDLGADKPATRYPTRDLGRK
jgi:hypothetical protein